MLLLLLPIDSIGETANPKYHHSFSPCNTAGTISRYLVEPPLVVGTIRRSYYYSDNVQCHRWIIIMVMNLNVQVLIYYTLNKYTERSVCQSY